MEYRYKVISSNLKEGITIREDELFGVLKAKEENRGFVICREGILNPSFIVGIVVDNERMRALADAHRGNYKLEEPSPFAHLLRDKFKMLSPNKRDDALVEASKNQRKK